MFSAIATATSAMKLHNQFQTHRFYLWSSPEIYAQLGYPG
jgi:hypothetical protein